MFIVLPNNDDGIDDLVKRVDSTNIYRMQYLLNIEEVKVVLPKFNFVNTVNLNEILKSVNIDHQVSHNHYIFNIY